jgi:hypothetical protein
MRVPLESLSSADYDERGDAVTPTGYPWTFAVRSWLVSGRHPFAIDPRRRTGSHGQLRRLLLEDSALVAGARGRWQPLVSALQRHSMHSAIAQLNAAQRQLITLAYHEGLTNRQIAAMLGVSTTTVRRRLWVALERLEEHVRRSRTWIASAILLALSYVSSRASRLGRLTSDAAASADWSHRLAAAVAAGVVTTAVVGLVVTSPQNSPALRRAAPATAAVSLPAATGFSRRSIRLPNRGPSHPAAKTSVLTQPDDVEVAAQPEDSGSKSAGRPSVRSHGSHGHVVPHTR